MGLLWDIITWPFRLAMAIIGWILSAAGRFIAFFIGLGLCSLGVLISLTVIGAVIGIPLMLFGGALMLSSIF